MITALFKDKEGQLVNIGWMDEGTDLILQAHPEGISAKFFSEPDGEEIELQFHPAIIKMLASWIEAQPKNTFMAKEGREEMLKGMAESDKEWDAKQAAKASNAAASKSDGIEPPF